jgi:hypothetical protein
VIRNEFGAYSYRNYNFGGTGPILGVKNPLQRVNGHAELNSRNLHELAL